MVDVKFYKIHGEKSSGVTIEANRLVFNVPKPTVLQPGEIIKVFTGVVVKVPKGHIVTLTTHAEIVDKACELFPNVITLDENSPETELALAVRNSGRNQLNLMPGTLVAVGHVTQISKIEAGDFEPDVVANPQLPGTKPQKKNPFQFEVK